MTAPAEESTQIVEAEAQRAGTLLPVLDPKAAKEAYQAYLELCQAILIPYDKRIVRDGVVVQESDYARIPQRRKVNGRWITEYVDAPKKSAWRKLARFYGVSTEILEKSKETHQDGSFTYHYTVRASAGGVSTTGEGSCTSTEKGGKSEHDTRATAHTRAKSRAISDLIGFGQVSAEEYSTYENDPEPPKNTAPRKRVEAGARVKPRRQGAVVEDVGGSAEDDPDVQAVLGQLKEAGLSTGSLILVKKDGRVWVQHPETWSQDRWNSYNDVIHGELSGSYSRDLRAWAVTP